MEAATGTEAPSESALVFNVVYTRRSFRYLKYFAASLLANSTARLRFVANACGAGEVRAMRAFAKRSRGRVVDVVEITQQRTAPHGDVLDHLFREVDTGPWFCFVDSDIKAVRPFVADLLHELVGRAVVTACRPAWSDDTVMPSGTPGLGGQYLSAADGFVFGSSFAAVMQRSAVEDVRRRWGVGFASVRNRELPPAARERIAELGRSFLVYDTGKALNILLQGDGHGLVHIDHDGLVHIGGMSRFLLRPVVRWEADPESSTAAGEEPGRAGRGPGGFRSPQDEIRWRLSEFSARTLRALVEHEGDRPSIVALPASMREQGELIQRELVDLIERYGEPAAGTAATPPVTPG